MWNSVRYSALIIALTFLPPVALAILLQEVPRGKSLFRVVYYLPAVTSGLAIILLWKQFYEGSEYGALNAVLIHVPAIAYIAAGLALLWIAMAFTRRVSMHGHRAVAACFAVAGFLAAYTCCSLTGPIFAQKGVPFWRALFMAMPESLNWLLDPGTAMFCCVLPMVWAGIGPGCLIYLAALKSIPDESYEAADIDGATFIDKILFVVFPTLKPLLLINFVGVFIGSWNASGNILAMTGGGANTTVADLSIFYSAFMYLKFGQATAMAWVLGAMLVGFTVYQLRILSRLEFKSTGDKE
ncbi:MAG: sugar ABC transporter permease [bacterium]